MSHPQPYFGSRFEGLPQNVTMIQYEDVGGMTVKLETKLNDPVAGGEHPFLFQSKIQSDSWEYLEEGPNISPVILSTLSDYRYYGPLIMGTPNQLIKNVCYSTGFGWLAIKSIDCSLCTNTSIFDYRRSSTFSALSDKPIKAETETLSYAGFPAAETVCISENGKCINNFEWLNSYFSSSKESDGILGLRPDQYYDGTPPLLVHHLYSQGAIAEPIFGMGLRQHDDVQGSFIDVGFTDSYGMATGVVGQVDVSAGQGYWASYLTGIRFRMQTTYDLDLEASMRSVEEFNLGVSYGYDGAVKSVEDSFLAKTDTSL